ncbi:hypothetical protein OQA88_10023 [Cercophora sp. LCS_1]
MDSISSRLSRAFKSKRLIYRALEDNEQDQKALYDAIQSDPINMGLSCPVLFTPRSRKECVAETGVLATKMMLSVMICLPASSTNGDTNGDSEAPGDPVPIGYLALTKAPDVLVQCRESELIIQLGNKYQNEGYGKEAVEWAIDWAFRFGNLHRVGIQVVMFNERAYAVYKKVGFVEEGRKREVIWFDGGWWDLCLLGVLRREWEAREAVAALG